MHAVHHPSARAKCLLAENHDPSYDNKKSSEEEGGGH